MTTRFPSGITNVAAESVLGNMGAPDPSKFQIVFDDFSALITGQWAVVETQAGATQAVVAGAGGLVIFTNSATIGDVNAFTTNLAIFQLLYEKRFFAKMRLAMTDVANENFFLGFGDTGAALNPANGAYMQKSAANGGTVTVAVETASAVVSNTVTGVNAYLANGVQTILGLDYDGRGTLSAYVNDRKLVSVSGITSIPGTLMLGIGGYSNVNAFANTASLDYLLFAVER